MTLVRAATTGFVAAAAFALGGCATVTGPTPSDPLEGFNRAVFSFNETLDSALIKPVATGYQAVLPQFVRDRIGNFFDNFGDGWSAVNQLLQGKPSAALEMGLKFGVNTVFGFGGFVDVAGAGIERRREDFGQTLGRWGIGPGPYLVLPLFGPSTLRDTAALTLDWRATPEAFVDRRPERWGLAAVHVISVRASLLSTTRTIDEIAFDKYALIRDGYLARRRSLVYDGNPPEEPDADDSDASEPTPTK